MIAGTIGDAVVVTTSPCASRNELAGRMLALTVYFLDIGECREVLGGGPAPPSKFQTLRV